LGGVAWRWSEIGCLLQGKRLEVSYQGGTEKLEELRTGGVLRSGNYYKIRFTTTEDSYVYIFQIDGSQTISQLFPHSEGSKPDIEGSNPVKAQRTYFVPSEHRSFILDSQVGQERIYPLVFSERNTAIEYLYQAMIEARDLQDTERLTEARRQLADTLKKSSCEPFHFQHM
jgi:Domain of unknown function (DUF4384)